MRRRGTVREEEYSESENTSFLFPDQEHFTHVFIVVFWDININSVGRSTVRASTHSDQSD